MMIVNRGIISLVYIIDDTTGIEKQPAPRFTHDKKHADNITFAFDFTLT